MVMRFTSCDKHLINAMANVISKVRPLLIPGVVLGTFLVNIALPSAAGTAAAAGAIFIPLLMGAGVHPAIAAAAVKCGTYGSMLNPGLAHNPFVAKIAGDASRFDLLLASLHRFADGAAGDFNIVEP